MEFAGWFVGPIMEKIINAFSDYLEDQVGWQTGTKKELESLRENHPKIQAVVFAADQAQIGDQNPALNKWIWRLRDALDEADDLLDELEYIKHKEQLPKNTEETKFFKNKMKKVRSMKKIVVKISQRVLKRDPKLKRLEEAVQKLDKVSADVTSFLHLVDITKKEQKEQEAAFYRDRETGSLPTTNDLIGRAQDKYNVTQWLKKLSNEHRDRNNISLLSIVGHGGMGKTTLLQHVYEDEMTKEFDLKMWVCVSNNFDVKKVIADMLSTLKKERPRLDDTLDALQNSLKNEIMSKRFLLVLDDIWEEEENNVDISKWEKVLAPLAYGKIGSGILVTTRMDSVAAMIAKVIKKDKETYNLPGLKEDECLLLLNSHAFAGVENPNDYKKLRFIAGEIVKKLSGSPLAAKVIGGVLNSSLDERHWTKVLNSDFVSPKSGQNDIFLILRLSYTFLPKHLQNCFAFCSIFKQDYRFDKDDLVKMWIALGFIQQPHDQEWTMEDIGGIYFDELVKKSFFDKFSGCYKMHDLIHGLAQLVSKHECLRVEDGTKFPSIIPKTLRHLSLKTTNRDIIRKIGQFKYLHSLFLFYNASNEDISAFIEVFKTSRSLRLLYVSAPVLKMLPEEIRNLIHLRYLRIFCSKLTMLPRSLSNLFHLKYIICNGHQPKVDIILPSDINSLSNLRYMELPQNCISSICGIGKLKFLQKLDMYDLRDERGYRIGELENMNDLCILGINCLENVKDAEEARSAKLCAKRRLTDLTLCWSNIDSRNINLDENVVDSLQPPKRLRNLRIYSYMGARSAIWMNNVNPIFNNLEKIQLEDCLECETLPPFGQFPFLKSLTLSNMPKVKWLECKFNGNDDYHACFPLLEWLRIDKLEALEDWFEAGVAAAEDGCFFPCLIQLELWNCPKLKELPSLPSKLKRLEIRSMGWETLNFCSNSNPIPLETLKVLSCPNITSLPLADKIVRLAALRGLVIRKCPNLISLGEMPTTNNCHLILDFLEISDPSVLLMEPLRSIASLDSLVILYNDEVVSFPNEAEQWFLNVRSSLSELCFWHLKSLESLPSSLESLSSLGLLHIEDVPMLRELPNLPPSLESLDIEGCPNITSLPLADEIARLAALRWLDIRKCPNLISLGEMPTTNNCHLILHQLSISDPSVLLMEPLRSIASLEKLRIADNDEVVSFPNEAEQWFLNVSSSLSELRIEWLKSLESLPSSLESLSSLQELVIMDVPMLRELPNLPPNLQSLYISGCHPELKERYGEDGGSHRHNIAHIPSIDIDT